MERGQQHPTSRWPAVLCLLASTFLPLLSHAGTGVTRDPETTLRTWLWRHGGVTLQLVQRLPDQTRAFFQGRGFDGASADRLARACVFQTIFRNDGDRPLSYDLDQWRVIQGTMSKPLITRERWAASWPQSKGGRAAQIALRWSLLPTRQQFQPGDYNWGMTSFGLPPGAVFDLSLVMVIDGQTVSGHIPSLVCPEERK